MPIPQRFRSVLLAGSLVLASAAAAPAQESAALVDTRMVEVDGHPMRVQTAGWQHRERGQPIVVFENGAGTPLEAWQPILAAVAGFAPVVAYDRAGIGRSPWDGQPPTPPHVTRKLRALLATLGAEPPYVLVGFSWGGPLIQHFTDAHPGEVAGLVYIDAPDITQRRALELAAFREIGAGEAERGAYYRTMLEFMAQASPGDRAETEVIANLMTTDAPTRPTPPHPEIPVAVLVAGRYQPLPPGIQLPFDDRAFWEAALRQTIRVMNESLLVAPEATLIVATHARHYMHGDDPALVIEAIRRVSFPDIARQLQQALAGGGAAAAVERYHQLKLRFPAERFQEALLNTFGYDLLRGGNTDAAVAIFELNVREYPGAPNPYDSLGDAYSAASRLAEARARYERAVQLAETAGDPRLSTFRANLERVERQLRERR